MTCVKTHAGNLATGTLSVTMPILAAPSPDHRSFTESKQF